MSPVRRAKTAQTEMDPWKLAINALHHYYVTAVNHEGSGFTPLSSDRENPVNFFTYMCIVENNINSMINRNKQPGKQRLHVYLSKDNLANLLCNDDFYINRTDGLVRISQEIGPADIDDINFYLSDKMKGLLKDVFEKSYKDLKDIESKTRKSSPSHPMTHQHLQR